MNINKKDWKGISSRHSSKNQQSSVITCARKGICGEKVDLENFQTDSEENVTASFYGNLTLWIALIVILVIVVVANFSMRGKKE